MKKGYLIVFILFFCFSLQAQTKPSQAETEEKKQEVKVVKEEIKGEPVIEKKETALPEVSRPEKEIIKSVPAAKEQHAKPAHIDQRRSVPVRPERMRPARNPRPAGRIIKPGRG